MKIQQKRRVHQRIDLGHVYYIWAHSLIPINTDEMANCSDGQNTATKHPVFNTNHFSVQCQISLIAFN